MYKRLLLAGFLMLSLVLSPFMASPAKAVVANTLIKIDGSPTVYWYANDGRRYVFPNPRTFYSWFSSDDLNRVVTISPYELGSISLGGNVTYRPGVRLVKVTTDPRVYAVSRYGTLRWITSEALAQQLYGQNWAQQIDDVPDEFFTNYHIGDAVYNASQFNVQFEMGQARSPSENITSNTNNWPTYPTNPNTNGYITLNVSNSTPVVTSNDSTVFTASVTNSPFSIQYSTLSIIRADTGEIYQTCRNSSSCTFTFTGLASNFAGQTLPFFTRLTNTQTGATYDSSRVNIYPRQNTATNYYNQATAHTLTFSQSSVRPGDSFTVTARLTPDTNAAPYYTIRIYDQWNVLQLTCERVRTCVLQQTLSQTTDTSRTYYATATGDNGHSISSGNATIQITPSSSSEINGRLGTSSLTNALSAESSIATAPNLTVYSGTKVTFGAYIPSPPSNVNGFSIKLYQVDGILLKTCVNASSCYVDKILTNVSSSTDVSYSFNARLDDTFGNWDQTSPATVVVRTTQQAATTFNAKLMSGVSPTTVKSGESFTLSAYVSDYNIPAQNLGIAWYQEDGTSVLNCYGQTTCNATTNYLAGNGSRTMRFYFTAWDTTRAKSGNLQSDLIPVTILP